MEGRITKYFLIYFNDRKNDWIIASSMHDDAEDLKLLFDCIKSDKKLKFRICGILEEKK